MPHPSQQYSSTKKSDKLKQKKEKKRHRIHTNKNKNGKNQGKFEPSPRPYARKKIQQERQIRAKSLRDPAIQFQKNLSTSNLVKPKLTIHMNTSKPTSIIIVPTNIIQSPTSSVIPTTRTNNLNPTFEQRQKIP